MKHIDENCGSSSLTKTKMNDWIVLRSDETNDMRRAVHHKTYMVKSHVERVLQNQPLFRPCIENLADKIETAMNEKG